MSRLEDSSKAYRDALIAKNGYKNTKPYNSSHKNALSDGDEKGKGENGDSIGGITDIKTREALTAKNKYSNNKPYNDSNA